MMDQVDRVRYRANASDHDRQVGLGDLGREEWERELPSTDDARAVLRRAFLAQEAPWQPLGVQGLPQRPYRVRDGIVFFRTPLRQFFRDIAEFLGIILFVIMSLPSTLRSMVGRLRAARAGVAVLEARYARGERCTADVFMADQPNSPIVVFVHGGAWAVGDPSHLFHIAEHLRKNGFTVVLARYLLHRGKSRQLRSCKQMVEDIHACVLWVQEKALSWRSDPTRIVLAGHSAGAHLAALSVLESAHGRLSPLHVRALVGFGGVYDIGLHFIHEAMRGVAHLSPMHTAMGASIDGFDEFSPVYKARQLASRDPSGSAPRLPNLALFHSLADTTVPAYSSKLFAQAWRAAGGEADLHLLRQLSHMDTLDMLGGDNRFPAESKLAVHVLHALAEAK